MGSIFSVPALHTRTYRFYNSPSMNMHSLATLVCQIWVNYRWNMEITWQNVLIWMGSIKRLDLQTTYRYRAKHFRNLFLLGRATVLCSNKIWEYAGSVTAGRQTWKFLKFINISDLHRSPVSREQIGWWAPYFLCLLYIPVPTDPIIRQGWTCILIWRGSIKLV